MKESTGYKIFKCFNMIIMSLLMVVTIYPFLVVIAQSFSSEAYIVAGDVSIIPRGFNFRTYQAVMGDRMFWINYRNTVVYTVLGTIFSMMITTMIAYVLSKKRLLGRNVLLFYVVFTMFVQGGLIPNFVLVSRLNMLNTMWAVVIPGALSIMNVLIMKTFFENIPVELEEAASIDGLNQIGVLLRIILPLSKPIMATMVLFYAVGYWNSWVSAFLYLDQRELFPVTIYLRNLLAGVTGSQNVMAEQLIDNDVRISANIRAVTIILTMLPILTLYPFVQKYFVKGVMLGSVK